MSDIYVILAIPGLIMVVVNVIYAIKIVVNVFKKRPTESVQERVFWGTLVGPWLLCGLGGLIGNRVTDAFAFFAFAMLVCSFVSLIRLIYVYVTKKNEEKKKWVALTIISFILIMPIYAIGVRLEPDDVKQARIEAEEQAKQIAKEKKAQEEAQRVAEKEAEEKAATDKLAMEKEKEIQDRLMDMNEEDIALYKTKLQEYSTIMEEQKAKEKAINDVDQARAKKKQELQEAYDKQAQYEEWIAWQKSEEEEKAKEQGRKEKEATKNAEVNNNDSNGGWWNKVKSVASDLAADAVDYGAQVANDEVIIDELSTNEYMVYFKPSTKKEIKDGLIFKDTGYSVEVIIKSKIDIPEKNIKNGQIIFDKYYEYCKKDSYMKWRLQGHNNWNVMQEADEAKIIYNKTNKYPNINN